MSSFEFMKLAYLKSTGKEEPGVMATLAFGSISGSVGATSVYPLNLVRTRLQASGSSGHPQSYAGFLDVWNKTIAEDGVRGLYRGLVPTLAKVRLQTFTTTRNADEVHRSSQRCPYRMWYMSTPSASEYSLLYSQRSIS